MKTKAVTSFLGFMVGDFLAQRIGGEPFSPLRRAAGPRTRHVPHPQAGLTRAAARRCLRLGAYGLFLDGPIGHQCAPCAAPVRLQRLHAS